MEEGLMGLRQSSKRCLASVLAQQEVTGLYMLGNIPTILSLVLKTNSLLVRLPTCLPKEASGTLVTPGYG